MKNDTNNEVARLRETLELIASPMRPDGTYNRDRRACELLAKEALAPAPEEPVIQENRITEPSPEETQDGATMDEWRELGPDEVIQEGDECRFKGEAQYEPLMDSMIGGKPKRFRFYLSRSRRRLADKYREQLNQNKMNPQTPENEVKKPLSLPEVVLKQQQEIARLRELLNRAIEIADRLVDPFIRITGVPEHELVTLKAEARLAPAPEEPSEKDTSTETSPSQKDTEWRELGPDEVMPLDQIDESLKWIEGDGKYPLDHDEMFGEVCNCLRYLRDEIQKLKQK